MIQELSAALFSMNKIDVPQGDSMNTDAGEEYTI